MPTSAALSHSTNTRPSSSRAASEEIRAQVAALEAVMLHVVVSADWAVRGLNDEEFDQ